MLSLPDNWNFSTAGLTSILPSDGRERHPLRHQELESGGYLTRERIRDDRGKSSTGSGPSRTTHKMKTHMWKINMWINHNWITHMWKIERN